MSKTPLNIALEQAKVETPYRSSLEERIAEQLTEAGIKFEYEGHSIPYLIPERVAKYHPDFPITDSQIIIEGKGHFGANNFGRRFANMKDTSAKERKKFALLKEQHPELDIRFVFSRAEAFIFKGSKTTHAKWAEDHGFLWANKVVPPEWITEMQMQSQRKSK